MKQVGTHVIAPVAIRIYGATTAATIESSTTTLFETNKRKLLLRQLTKFFLTLSYCCLIVASFASALPATEPELCGHTAETGFLHSTIAVSIV